MTSSLSHHHFYRPTVESASAKTTQHANEDHQNARSASRVIESMLRDLKKGESISLDQIACRMHISVSTLRRRLKNENTTYRHIKDNFRKKLAIDLLGQDYKINQISDRLGFVESTSFVRAFKKWTGMSPSIYREKIKATGSK